MSFDQKRAVAAENGAAAAQVAEDRTHKFVTFAIGEEEYAVDILSVREIKGWTDTTELPNQSEYMRGVLNLRGLIVPIFDLRCRFGFGRTDATKSHVVIIVALENRTIGLLVDAVSDIISVQDREIHAVPQVEDGERLAFLTGLVAVREKMVAILAPALLLQKKDELAGLPDTAVSEIAAA